MDERNVNVIIGVTGSVATIKLSVLIDELFEKGLEKKVSMNIAVVSTERAEHFFKKEDLRAPVKIHTDSEEWSTWMKRGDPVLHIELVKWATIFVIAPLDANTLGKVANGLCDNLLTCIIRAWDMKKPLLFCPAMNTKMYEHPITEEHLEKLKRWGYHMINPISKKLMCGDMGVGAMAEVVTIVEEIFKHISVNENN